jgi:hypothetical protein
MLRLGLPKRKKRKRPRRFRRDLEQASVAVARTWVDKFHVKDRGVVCPTCDHLVRTYSRPLNYIMLIGCVALRNLYKVADRPYHVTEIGSQMEKHVAELRLTVAYPTTNFALLRHWDLVKAVGNKGEGTYIPGPNLTPWLSNVLALKSHAKMDKHGNFLCLVGRDIFPEDAAKKKFDLEELLNNEL